ncbi:hypothetical protein FisN_34Hu042 [Fistulifera solaris]|uniref:Uncharacterized protein n=1 Tax=Fistulifera solaris TaxID=1519565 RepID=A0A1Z5JB73_FISSO|nr:hypothetical protein FisN_34Hu042 [Fistulifera solaris]|eukprot:GAX11237.1 hypothetical protein FisN_34Hu042 [Fistulifera solaris]
MSTRSHHSTAVIVCVFLACSSIFYETVGRIKFVESINTVCAEKSVDDGIDPVGSVADTYSISVSKNPIDTSCLRFATMEQTFAAGLGHKVTEVIFGMVMAEETNSVFVLDDHIWLENGTHGSYDWLMDFLPLNETEFTKSELEALSSDTPVTTVLDRWDVVVNQSKEENNACNVLFSTRLEWCCDSADICYCTMHPPRIGSFDRVKWRMREAFSRSKYVPSRSLLDLGALPKNEPILTIVWHVRQGDIVLNARKEHFDKLASQIASVLSIGRIPVHVFLYGDGEIFENFPFLPYLCQQYFGGNCSYPALDVRDSLYYMIESDVLITSGSSFPIIAAVLRAHGVVLHEYPKEYVLGIYELAEHGLIEYDGTISTPSLRDLQYQLQFMFNQKIKKLRNP